MVWLLLGFFSSLSFANHEQLYEIVVPRPEANVILICQQRPVSDDEFTLKKEVPNLKVLYFESGYGRVWLAKNGSQNLMELPIIQFEGNSTPDFWTARTRLPGDNGYFQIESYVTEIMANGDKIHMLKVFLHDLNDNERLVMRMSCESLQTWI